MSTERKEYDSYCKTIEDYLEDLKVYLDSLKEETYEQVSDNLLSAFDQIRYNVSLLFPEERDKYTKMLDEQIDKFKLFGIIISIQRDSRKRPPVSEVETNKKQCEDVVSSSGTKTVENNTSFASLFTSSSSRSQMVYNNTLSSLSSSPQVVDKTASSSSKVDDKTVIASSSSSSTKIDDNICFTDGCGAPTKPDKKYCMRCFFLLSEQRNFTKCVIRKCKNPSFRGERLCFMCFQDKIKEGKRCTKCCVVMLSTDNKLTTCYKCSAETAGMEIEYIPCCAPGCIKTTWNRLPVDKYGPGKERAAFCRAHFAETLAALQSFRT